MNELSSYPDRFSPNVILRGIFQEIILPNVAFIGGGGELAYWFEFKSLFEHYKIPFPLLILRNSFLLINSRQQHMLKKLKLALPEIFKPGSELEAKIVRSHSSVLTNLEHEKSSLEKIYSSVKTAAEAMDPTLGAHAEGLAKHALSRLNAMEKKMIRAGKKKFEAEIRQLAKLRKQLFPGDGLQERVDNFLPYYAAWGKAFIPAIVDHSLGFEQRFTIITSQEDQMRQ